MSELNVDTINEQTSANGVSIDGVKLKDSIVEVDTINESTSGSGVTIDSVLLKDGVAHSGLVKLFSHTISNDADIDADVLDENTYSGYKLVAKDITTANDNTNLRAGFRASGSDVLTTNSYLRASWYSNTASSGLSSASANVTGYFEVSFNQGNDTGETMQAVVDFFPHGEQKLWTSINHYETNSGAQLAAHIVSILRNNTTVDGLRFYAGSGNLASGSIEIWGYKK
jgi:hypothetical protein